jgi:hypothetical protein
MSYHDEFKRGYIAGYQAGAGRNAIPPIPPTPTSLGGLTYYEVGYRRGFEAGQKM